VAQCGARISVPFELRIKSLSHVYLPFGSLLRITAMDDRMTQSPEPQL
jgi:hypothetical protein